MGNPQPSLSFYILYYIKEDAVHRLNGDGFYFADYFHSTFDDQRLFFGLFIVLLQ